MPADYSKRISLMTSYCVKFKGASEVPDPYYGGPEVRSLPDRCHGQRLPWGGAAVALPEQGVAALAPWHLL